MTSDCSATAVLCTSRDQGWCADCQMQRLGGDVFSFSFLFVFAVSQSPLQIPTRDSGQWYIWCRGFRFKENRKEIRTVNMNRKYFKKKKIIKRKENERTNIAQEDTTQHPCPGLQPQTRITTNKAFGCKPSRLLTIPLSCHWQSLSWAWDCYFFEISPLSYSILVAILIAITLAPQWHQPFAS